MRSKLFLAVFLIFFMSRSLFAYTGREIMEKSDALPDSETAQSKVLMYIHKGERVDEKEFELISKEFDNDEDRTLISFLRPTRIKLLTHSHKGRDDDQWLRLSSGRVKRIASSDKGKSFVNSHFYYEDLSSRDIDDYKYQYLGDEKVENVDCFKVEAVKISTNRVYDKTILYVRKSDFYVKRIDFYKKSVLLKHLVNQEVKKVKGILTPFKIVMSLANEKGRTELMVKDVQYNTNMRNNLFNKEALR
jgi:hypothetical protein